MTENENDIQIDEERLATLIDHIDVNTTTLAELKTETERNTEEAERENVKRDKRILWSRIGSIVAIVAAFVGITVGVWGFYTASDAHTAIVASQAESTARRIAFCNSLDDVGNAVKSGIEGAIVTLFDPQFQGPDSHPEVLQQFVMEFNANGAKGVDVAISQTKQHNGFTDDCQIKSGG